MQRICEECQGTEERGRQKLAGIHSHADLRIFFTFYLRPLNYRECP